MPHTFLKQKYRISAMYKLIQQVGTKCFNYIISGSYTPLRDKNNKKIISFALILSVSCFLLLALPSFPHAEIIDRVVAVVNDDVITLSELNDEGRDTLERITEQAPLNEQAAALQNARLEILSRMIDRKITVQKAQEMNISVTDAEIDATIETILARNKATQQDLQRELTARGISEETYRSSLREQILFSRLVSYEVNSKVVITEEKAREYYENRYMQDLPVGGYYLLQIGFNWDDKQDTKEKIHAEAMQVREAAINGQSFNQLAILHSNLPSANDGGDIGVIRGKEMAPAVRAAIDTLQPGDISPLIETDSGYILFKLLAANKEGTITRAPFDSVKEDILTRLRTEEQEKLYTKWVKDLREKAYIKELL
jgi:peptidyl-prolyl cis-trans isomerase SurA